ncbi:MAG TPA: folate-binding protein [Candidatus Nanopelagicales bacterium]
MTPQPIPAPPGSVDAGVPWHYGDPHAEQRALAAGRGAVDLGHRDVLAVTGADRLPWLHSLTTAHLLDLEPGDSRLVLILSPHGHVEHELHLVETTDGALLTVEPGTGQALRAYLDSMRFLMRVEVVPRPDLAVVWEPVAEPDPDDAPTWLVPGDYRGATPTPSGADRGGDATRYVAQRPAPLVGREVLVPREAVAARISASGAPAGTWALEAMRVAAAVPRLGFESDHRTLPHEVGWIGAGVHLAKGCYRGQEAVARVHNLGRPPRRLALAHLDGSAGVLPGHGDDVLIGERVVGWVGTAARHHELGPIATVVVKRGADPGADLLISTGAGDVVASQQVVVLP